MGTDERMAERMANFSALRKGCARLTSLLLTLALLATMLTGAALAEDTAGKVRVIVENTTFTQPVNGKIPPGPANFWIPGWQLTKIPP